MELDMTPNPEYYNSKSGTFIAYNEAAFFFFAHSAENAKQKLASLKAEFLEEIIQEKKEAGELDCPIEEANKAISQVEVRELTFFEKHLLEIDLNTFL